MTGLHIAPGVDLPLDAVTETFGILAKKGAGKSNAAVVMAEEMYAAGVPWVAVDPKGDWWGLRSSGDGQGAGLPIVVFGGRHGDVPLEPTAGALIADLVIEQNLTCVLDVSQFSDADTIRFLLAFAERLYRQADQDPIHLFLEEAHEYLPQMVRGDHAKLVHAWQRIVKQGRFKGLGVTLISQRSASLNKDVLTQVDTLIVLRTTSPQDRAAVKAWVDVHAEAGDMLATLPSLESGEAWLWSPEFLGQLQRIRFRRRNTFDSGATPKVGERRRTPATLADVDLAVIKEQMAETIEKAKADDPRELRKRIGDLEQQLAAAQAAEPEVTLVHVPAVTAEALTEFTSTAQPLSDLLSTISDELHRLAAQELPQAGNPGRPATRSSAPRATSSSRTSGLVPEAGSAAPREMNPPPARETRPAAGGGLPKAQRKILTVLAQQGTRSTTQVAILTGYSHKSGGYRNALSSLRSHGFIDGRGDITITPTGVDALGDWEPLPTGRDLLDWWKDTHLGKAECAIVDVLKQHGGGPVDTATIAELTGYSASSGGFRNALSRLRSLEIASGRGELALNPELVS